MARYRNIDNVRAAFDKLKQTWADTLGKLQARTPDPDFNTCFNTWNQYQSTMTTFLSRSISPYEWGIGRGVGFRDTSQDLMGMTHAWPEYVRRMLVTLMSVLWKDGAATHNFFPLTGEGQERDFNDDHLWLILSACHYVKETGDTALLEESILFKDAPPASAFEHLDRAIDRSWNLVGRHGLPQIGHADWNDGLNNPGDVTSESVFVAMLFCQTCREMAELCDHLGRSTDAVRYREYHRAMKERTNSHAWDGQWYRRILHTRGGYGGGMGTELGYIFVEPQPWAVISGVADGARAETAMASVHEHLLTDFGIAILKEAFPRYDPDIGSISIVLPGIKENGSVFCHCNPWVIVAETVLGHGDRAMEYYKLTSYTTVNRRADVHQADPYVYSQHICLPPHKHPGRAGNPWLTGSAGWFMQTMSHYILGIRPTYSGLRLDPCVPRAWKNWTVERTFRGARYRIRFENPAGVSKGVRRVTVDGKEIEGNVVSVFPAGTEHAVRVIMG